MPPVEILQNFLRHILFKRMMIAIAFLISHQSMAGSVVDYNKVTLEADKILITEKVARTMRDYIDNFFGCESCRQHFVTTFDSCGHDRCDRLKDEFSEKEMDWMQLPLWLYETHNAVNVRLLKERVSREGRDATPEELANVQWPPQRECSACWGSDGEWDEEIVYKYLRLEYGHRDAYSADLRREIMSRQESEPKQEVDREAYIPLYVTLSVAVVSMLATAYAAKRQLPMQAAVQLASPPPNVPDILDEIRAIANFGKLRGTPDIMDEVRAIANCGKIRKMKPSATGSGELLPPDLLIEQSTNKPKDKLV